MAGFHRSPVLVPVDYSVPSLNAAKIARTIAESDSDVLLVHVSLDFDLVVPSHNWVTDLPPDTDADRLKRLQAWRDDNDLGHVRCEARMGDPGTVVCRVAEEEKSRLIVIPSHGHHGLKRLLLGSVAERIVRHCHCSVLVLHRSEEDSGDESGSEQWLPRQKVLVPIDFSESSKPAIQAALQAAESPSCVEVVNVVPLLDDPVLIGSVVMTDEDRRAGRETYLQQWLKEQGYGELSGQVLSGDPGSGIVDHAVAIEADLIVIPSHGYHGLKRFVMGSTAERVLRHASTPVLVLRRLDAE